jgi:hypothetical protein
LSYRCIEVFFTQFLLFGHGTFPDEYALAFKLLAPPMVGVRFELTKLPLCKSGALGLYATRPKNNDRTYGIGYSTLSARLIPVG